MPRTPLDKLKEVSSDLAQGFQQLRKGALEGGPLTNDVAELVIVGALTSTRQHGALRVHIRRLFRMGVSPEAIRHAIIAPFGAASTLTETVEALDILQELIEGNQN